MPRKREPRPLTNAERFTIFVRTVEVRLFYDREIALERAARDGHPVTTCRLSQPRGQGVRVDLDAPGEVRLSASVETVLQALDLIHDLAPGGWEWEAWQE